jgi:hypothetical protein
MSNLDHAESYAAPLFQYNPCFAGSAIADAVLCSPYFKQCKRIGMYVTCEKLREVDTTKILKAALEQGKPV